MRGQVVEFIARSGTGVVATASGLRLTFTGADWLDDIPPARGHWVDFDPAGDATAVRIRRALTESAPMTSATGKTKAALTLWAIFLGGFGAHKFYMGSWGWGLVYLLTSWLSVPFLVAFVEWIRYILLTDEEFRMRADAFAGKGPFGFFW